MNKAEIERQAMERYARAHMEDRDKRRAIEKFKKHPHIWNTKFTGTNQAIKKCVVEGCGLIIKKGWTSSQKNQIMNNLEDFAQPGSELWNKIHGKKS